MRGIHTWDSLPEAQRLRVLAVVQAAANTRARAERDLYASNFTDDPEVELLGVALEGDVLIVRYLFHWWEYCAAQSGSDWNYDKYWQGIARMRGDELVADEASSVAEIPVSEWQADFGGYSRAANLDGIRARVVATLDE